VWGHDDCLFGTFAHWVQWRNSKKLLIVLTDGKPCHRGKHPSAAAALPGLYRQLTQ
jgi:hypothetical protein